MKARDSVLQEESPCIKQEPSICPLVIIEHIGAAAELFNACQSRRRASTVLNRFHVEIREEKKKTTVQITSKSPGMGAEAGVRKPSEISISHAPQVMETKQRLQRNNSKHWCWVFVSCFCVCRCDNQQPNKEISSLSFFNSNCFWSHVLPSTLWRMLSASVKATFLFHLSGGITLPAHWWMY